MFLVNNDQPQIAKGGKKSGTGAYHDLEFPLSCPFELVISLTLGKPGIDNRNLIPKSPVKSSYSLIGKSNFRNQHNSLFSLMDHLIDQFHINLCLSASCDSIKKYRP